MHDGNGCFVEYILLWCGIRSRRATPMVTSVSKGLLQYDGVLARIMYSEQANPAVTKIAV